MEWGTQVSLPHSLNYLLLRPREMWEKGKEVGQMFPNKNNSNYFLRTRDVQGSMICVLSYLACGVGFINWERQI